jgi:hypothetical protein
MPGQLQHLGHSASDESRLPVRGARPRDPDQRRDTQPGMLASGLLAGVAGVAAMTLAEKLEQAVTGRPNSYVPAHTLERLLGLPGRAGDRSPAQGRLRLCHRCRGGPARAAPGP